MIRDSTARNNCQSQKKLQPGIGFLFWAPEWLSRLRYRRMNIDVTLWAKYMGAALGEVEFGCSAGWTLGWVLGGIHGTTRRLQFTSGIALCSNLLDPMLAHIPHFKKSV